MGRWPKETTEAPTGLGIRCPVCDTYNTSVKDSRPGPDFQTRRRRICGECNFRFTTYEVQAEIVEQLGSVQAVRLMRTILEVYHQLGMALTSVVENVDELSSFEEMVNQLCHKTKREGDTDDEDGVCESGDTGSSDSDRESGIVQDQ
jgi:hypothetical protein